MADLRSHMAPYPSSIISDALIRSLLLFLLKIISTLILLDTSLLKYFPPLWESQSNLDSAN